MLRTPYFDSKVVVVLFSFLFLTGPHYWSLSSHDCRTKLTTMARNKILRVRLSDQKWARLESYAKSKEYTITEVIRDYIKRLPKVDSLRSG